MSEEETEAFCREMSEQPVDTREALVEDIGGVPDDYNVEEYLKNQASESVANSGE